MRRAHRRAAGDQQLQAAIASRKFGSIVTVAASLETIIAVGIVVAGLTS